MTARVRFGAPTAAVALFLVTCFAPHGLLGAELDTSLFRDFGMRIADGEIPYRDFSLEYPPGALPVFVLPELAPWDYATTFKALLAFCGALAAAASAFSLATLGARGLRLAAGIAAASLVPVVLGPVSLIRYDLWPAAFVAAGLAALLTGRSRLGAALWGAGAAAKLYALALGPLLALRRRQDATPFVLAGVLIAAPFALVGAGGLAHSLERQVSRGLEVESLGAGLLLALHQAGAYTATVEPRSGSFDVVGGLPEGIAVLQSVLQLAAIAAVWALFARSRRGPQELATATAATVAVAIAFGKILSPQFLLWLVPLVPLAAGAWGAAGAATFVASAALTHALYPGRHQQLVDLEPAPTWILVTRNLLLVATAVFLVLSLRAAPRGEPDAAPGSRSGRPTAK